VIDPLVTETSNFWQNHGESNDVAVIWSEQGGPIVMSVFSTSRRTDDTDAQKAAIAGTARAVFEGITG
ncbi:MAG: hypothetical protein L0G59_11930, partial [Kocuria sp.]|nr:hypothetical protein [Kocuria sp.]